MSLRFLVVDDSVLNLKVVETMLSRLNLESDCVDGAEKAYERVTNNTYSMIFMDYLMPGIDGIEATKHIRSLTGGIHDNDYYQNIPIIALTAESSDSLLKEMSKAGINAILPKPFTIDRLKEVMAKWCPGECTVYGIPEASFRTMITTDSSTFCEVLALFVEDIPAKFERIRSALSAKDYQSYTTEVHRIKGEAAIIGADTMSKTCLALELVGKALTGVVPNGLSDEANLKTIARDTEPMLAELQKMQTSIEAYLAQSGHSKETDSVNKDTAHEDRSASGRAISAELVSKLIRYTEHARESLAEGDTKLTDEWLGEIASLLQQL